VNLWYDTAKNWQPKCWEKRESNEHGLISPAFFALAFENELEYHYLYVRINSTDDQATFGGALLTSRPISRVHANQLCTTGVDQQLG